MPIPMVTEREEHEEKFKEKVGIIRNFSSKSDPGDAFFIPESPIRFPSIFRAEPIADR
ncbi:hypothetical protein ACV229_08710 [Burkholderia sp. MR1-5-21]